MLVKISAALRAGRTRGWSFGKVETKVLATFCWSENLKDGVGATKKEDCEQEELYKDVGCYTGAKQPFVVRVLRWCRLSRHTHLALLATCIL